MDGEKEPEENHKADRKWMKVIAVIPCFSEQETIGGLVFRANQLVGMVIVADDSSADNSAKRAEAAGAYVIRRFGKRGYGLASEAGITEALVRECDIVVTIDGDGQHNPDEMRKFTTPIEKGEADVVIGSRFLSGDDKNIPKFRKFGIKVITWLCNLGSRTKFTDVQCGYRAYRQDVLRAISLGEEGMSFSVETLIKARNLGFRIKEVPVRVLYPKQYRKDTIRHQIRQGLGVAFCTVRLRVRVELWEKAKRHWQNKKPVV